MTIPPVPHWLAWLAFIAIFVTCGICTVSTVRFNRHQRRHWDEWQEGEDVWRSTVDARLEKAGIPGLHDKPEEPATGPIDMTADVPTWAQRQCPTVPDLEAQHPSVPSATPSGSGATAMNPDTYGRHSARVG